MPYLCGGTFYILLLQSLKKDRRIRVNDLDGCGAKDRAINDVTCLKGLVRVFYDFNENFSDSTFTAHKDDFKFCRKNSTDWLRFENSHLVGDFNDKVMNNFPAAMADMDIYIDTYLDDGNLGENLVRALLETLYLDKSIKGDQLFYMQPNGVGTTKDSILQMPKIDARPFLLAVWHFIIVKRGSLNTEGQPTVAEWLKNTGKQAPYKYVGTMGENFAKNIEISFEKKEYVSEESENQSVAEADDDRNEDAETVYEEEKEDQGQQASNQILNAGVVVNQHAEKIVNIGHVDHLEI